MEKIAETVVLLLEKRVKPPEIEIEARLKKQLLTPDALDRLEKQQNIYWQETRYIEKRRISSNNRKSVYRQRNEHVICKSIIAKEDLNDLWCTLHVSTETPIPFMSGALESVEPKIVIVRRTRVGNCYVDVILDEGETSRVEIEVCDASAFDKDDLAEVVRLVCRVLQGSQTFMGYYEHKIVSHMANVTFDAFCIDDRKYQKPVTMTMKELLEISEHLDDWVVTPKVDGVRMFIVIVNGGFYAVDVAKNVRLEAKTDGDYSCDVTVLDCEYVDKTRTYYVFDVAVSDGKYCGRKHLEDRIEIALEIVEFFPDDLRMRTIVKPYEQFNSFDSLLRLYGRFQKEYDMDGLVFVNKRKDYMQQVVKWKAFSTVDLEVRDGNLMTSDDWKVDLRWTGSLSGVWEFMWQDDTLVPTKPRPDKPNANSRKIIERNLIQAVPGTIFSGVGCYLMRKYHNRVKSQLLRKANLKNSTVLDIGSGQGGDVGKWKHAKHVYCVEPSVDSTEELLARIEDDTKITVFNVPLRDLDTNAIKSKIDVFTAFFCTNLFESADWDALTTLIDQKGSRHCRFLAIALTNPRKHDDRCFSITMRGLNEYNITLHETRITNVTETIIKPAFIAKQMEKCNMQQVKQENLNDYDFMTQAERSLSSMYTMFVYKHN